MLSSSSSRGKQSTSSDHVIQSHDWIWNFQDFLGKLLGKLFCCRSARMVNARLRHMQRMACSMHSTSGRPRKCYGRGHRSWRSWVWDRIRFYECLKTVETFNQTTSYSLSIPWRYCVVLHASCFMGLSWQDLFVAQCKFKRCGILPMFRLNKNTRHEMLIMFVACRIFRPALSSGAVWSWGWCRWQQV